MSPHTYDPNTPEGKRIANHWEGVRRAEQNRTRNAGRAGEVPAWILATLLIVALIGVMYLGSQLGH